MNIYGCGNHTKISKKYKVVYDKTKKMYLVNCNPEYCDSGRKF